MCAAITTALPLLLRVDPHGVEVARHLSSDAALDEADRQPCLRLHEQRIVQQRGVAAARPGLHAPHAPERLKVSPGLDKRDVACLDIAPAEARCGKQPVGTAAGRAAERLGHALEEFCALERARRGELDAHRNILGADLRPVVVQHSVDMRVIFVLSLPGERCSACM
eukprot:364283-Chlamydomonas_euryale.AAC.2